MIITLSQTITLLFTSFLRIRLVRQIVSHTQKHSLIRISLSSLMSVILLSLIAFISQANLIPLPSNTILIVVIFIIVIFWFQSKRFFARWIQSLIRIAWSFIPNISQYPLFARSEESLKRNSVQKRTTWPFGEIILLCVMSSLVFGRWENIIYLLAPYIHNNNIEPKLVTTLIVSRSFIPLVLHIGCTCSSCLIAYTLSNKIWNTIIWRSIWLISGILLHTLFNISQSSNIRPLSLIIILWCIAIISYSLMRSDILYIQDEVTI